MSLPGEVVEPFLVAADGSVAVLYRDSQLGRRFVTLLGRDGRQRPGWPLTLPGGGWIETLLVASDGTIVVVGGSAVRLVLAADPSGAASPD